MCLNREMIRLVIDGRWSGGGRAVVDNLSMAIAAAPHEFSYRDGISLVPRNFTVRRPVPGGLVLMPQNAWPWSGPWGTRREAARKLTLRVLSDRSIRQADQVLRLCSLIPDPRQSPILPNVLDAGFDDALGSCLSLLGDLSRSILAPGSIGSYRNLERLLEAYQRYRTSGGSCSLTIVGGVTDSAVYSRLTGRASSMKGVRVVPHHLERGALLDAMRSSHAIFFPSLVEASPITLLEALALAPRVHASDIVGHRETAGSYQTAVDFFSPVSVHAICQAMLRSEAVVTNPELFLEDPALRKSLRENWAVDLLARIRC